MCLTNLERNFFSMQVLGDLQNIKDPIPSDIGYFYPLSYTRRKSAWTQDQVVDVFGSFIHAN